MDTGSEITLIWPEVLTNMQWRSSTGWETTNVWLALVTGAHTIMHGKRQLTVSLNGIMKGRNFGWLTESQWAESELLLV